MYLFIFIFLFFFFFLALFIFFLYFLVGVYKIEKFFIAVINATMMT